MDGSDVTKSTRRIKAHADDMAIEDEPMCATACMTRLSRSVTVNRYEELEKAADEGSMQAKQEIGAFIVERFDERYFNPVLNSCSKHGFTMMAVGCLVIETLEAFYQGLGDTEKKGDCRRMFKDFFGHIADFSDFGDATVRFYTNIRCGILHQAEARGGWRILRRGCLLDTVHKTINAELFIQELRKAVIEYACQLQVDLDLWEKFKKKMKRVCENCKSEDGAIGPDNSVGGQL